MKTLFFLLFLVTNCDLCEEFALVVVNKREKQSFTDKFPKSFNKPFAYSGKRENDLGMFEECSNLKDARYLLFTKTLGKFKYFLGVCFPNKCDSQTLKSVELDSKIKYTDITVEEPEKDLKVAQKNNRDKLFWLLLLVALFILLYTIYYVGEFNSARSNRYGDNPKHFTLRAKPNSPEKWRKKTVISVESKQNSVFIMFIQQFDLERNARRIFKTEMNEFKIIYAIRVIALFFMFFSFSFYLVQHVCMSNKSDLPIFLRDGYFLLYSQLPLAIDVFLFTSGFIVYFKLHSFLLEDNPKLRIFLSFLGHKIVSQFPVLLLTSIVILCMPLMGTGPLFLVVKRYSTSYSELLLQVFTYCQNVVYPSIPHHLWLISVEMQIFTFYLGLVCLLKDNPKVKWVVLCLITFISLLSGFVISFTAEFKMFFYYDPQLNSFQFEDKEFSIWLYQNTFTRGWPFLLGTIIGKLYASRPKIMKSLFLNEAERQEPFSRSSSINSSLSQNELYSFTDVLRESKTLGVFFLFLGWALMSYPLVTHVMFAQSNNRTVSAFSNAFDSAIFLLGMSFSLLVISVDYFFVIRKLFDNNVFYTLSNAHYPLFLLTPVMIILYFCSQQTFIYFSFGDFFLRTCGIVLLSAVLSVLVTVVVHLPLKLFMNKIAFRGMKKVI